MKLALPTSVPKSPNCCSDSEIKRTVPQAKPPIQSVLSFQTFFVEAGVMPRRRSKTGSMANTKAAPITERPQVKAKGEMCSMPSA